MQRLKGQMVAKLNGSCMAMGSTAVHSTPSATPRSAGQASRKTISKMKLLHPEIYDEYVTVSESRRFCIKGKSGGRSRLTKGACLCDSEQEHSGITGCRVTYESTIFTTKQTNSPSSLSKPATRVSRRRLCSGRYYGDRMLCFTAVGYELPRTKAVELELDGEWVEASTAISCKSSSGRKSFRRQRTVCWHTWVPGLSRASVPRQQKDIVATFGPDTLNILDNEPEKLLQIRGITEELKDIEESYAEPRSAQPYEPFGTVQNYARHGAENLSELWSGVCGHPQNARMICARFPGSDSSVWMASSVRRITACTAPSASRARCCTIIGGCPQ